MYIDYVNQFLPPKYPYPALGIVSLLAASETLPYHLPSPLCPLYTYIIASVSSEEEYNIAQKIAEVIINAENLGKLYEITEILNRYISRYGYKIFEDLPSWYAKKCGKSRCSINIDAIETYIKERMCIIEHNKSYTKEIKESEREWKIVGRDVNKLFI